MFTETLSKLRKGLSEKRFTMKALSDKSGVPVPTIADMKRADWKNRTIENLQAINSALDQIDAEQAAEAEADA